MDHQFLNVDCHPPSLPRPALHPSYAGSSCGSYPLDVHQPQDGNPLVSQFNPYRLPVSSDPGGHPSSLSSLQFSAFDSFYKAYQSAYGQNSSLAGVMFGHPSYRFDGPLLPHEQQLMLPTGFLQYPHSLFSNSPLYASFPGSSSNPRYPPDYFGGQNLSGPSSFSGASKFPSVPDIAPGQSWLGLDRSMPSNLLNAFAAPAISSDSTKEDRHGADSSSSKKGASAEGEHCEGHRSAYASHATSQPGSSSHLKSSRHAEDGSRHHHHHHLSSSNSSLQSVLLQNDSFNPRDGHQRRGNGELSYPAKRQEESYSGQRGEDKKSELLGQVSVKESSFLKRAAIASPQVLCKSTSFPVMSTFPEGSCIADGSCSMAQNFARHNSDYLFNHYASKLYPPSSFPSELLSLQSRTPLSSTFYQQQQQQQNPQALQRLNDRQRHEGSAKSPRSEDKVSQKNCLPLSGVGARQASSNQQPADKSFEQKFHRPFELASSKEAPQSLGGNNLAQVQKIKKSCVKAGDRSGGLHRGIQQNSHYPHHPQHNMAKSNCEQVFQNSHVDKMDSEPSVQGMSSNQRNPTRMKSNHAPSSRAEEETPLNLACGNGRSRFSPVHLVSKLDLEEAWRSSARCIGSPGEVRVQPASLTGRDSSYSDLYNEYEYEYEYERKIARLTTLISSVPIDPSSHSADKVDFLSGLGLSTIAKCRDLEYEKHRRRKRQLRERSISPIVLKEEEEDGFGGCILDCPHKNGMDKGAMLAMLGLHQVGMSECKGKYYGEGEPMSADTPSGLPYGGDSSTSQSFSYSPSAPFYSFPAQYPPSHLPTSVYNFYNPSYLINQPSSLEIPSSATNSLPSSVSSTSSSSSSSFSSSSSSLCSSAASMTFASPYCSYYDGIQAVTSKTQSYPYHSSHCFDGQQAYYQQDGSSFTGYGNFENQNPRGSSPKASGIMMERCISSTPLSAAHPRVNAPSKECSPLENGLTRGSEPNLFHWPGIDSIIESYHRYVEERAMERQLLSEHSAKLCSVNSDFVNAYEQLKNKISDLRKVQMGLDEERNATQSRLDELKNFIMQLK